jgi:ribosome biogenesis GTPase
VFVVTPLGRKLCRATGRLRRTLGQGEGPVVGDWVLVRSQEHRDGFFPLEAIAPRRTVLRRRAAGSEYRTQWLASHVDRVLIVCAATTDVQPDRIQRFVAIAREGGCEPHVVVTKIDLVGDPGTLPLAQVDAACDGVAVHLVSAWTGEGMAALAERVLSPGRTVVMLGRSGAGKSSLLNAWLGEAVQRTGEVSDEGLGRHVTTSRSLFVLACGTIVIDTPGVREVGILADDDELSLTFEDIEELARTCRFRDCRHRSEPGCAVQAAIAAGTLQAARLTQWRLLVEGEGEVSRGAVRPQTRR